MFENGSLELPLNKVKVVDDDGKSRYISFASNSNNNRAEQEMVMKYFKKKKRKKTFTHLPKNSDGQIGNQIFFEVRLMNNISKMGFNFSTVDDVVKEISIREKIATLERCEEIATTERCEEIATSERCEETATTEISDKEILENDDVIDGIYMCEEKATTERCDKETVENDVKHDEDDKAASESTTSYSIHDIKADHQQTESTATNFNDLTNARKPIEKMALPSIVVKLTYKHGLDFQQTKEDENKQVRCMYKSYIKDKKIDVDLLSSTTARKKMGIKRKLFEDTGEQDFINLKKLPTTNKMKMVENFIVNSNKAVAHVPKHITDMDFCKELLGETDETRNVIKFQMLLEKHPGNKSFSTSLETNMAKLQTSVSKEHNRLKNMLLDAHIDIDASINRKIRIAEMLMKKWKIYFW